MLSGGLYSLRLRASASAPHSHAISPLARVMRKERTRHGEQHLNPRGEDEPHAAFGADMVADAPERRAEPERNQSRERLLVALLEAARARRRRVEVARDRDGELRDVAGLEARPDVACLMSAPVERRLTVKETALLKPVRKHAYTEILVHMPGSTTPASCRRSRWIAGAEAGVDDGGGSASIGSESAEGIVSGASLSGIVYARGLSRSKTWKIYTDWE